MYSKAIIFVALFAVVYAASVSRSKREAFVLPDGIEYYLSITRTNFQCTAAGYYADVEADCRLFHVCVPQEFPDGKSVIEQYTFACGNQTQFNQFSLTCAHESEAVPCAQSADFFYLNERIGTNEFIHTDDDVARYNQYIGRQ
jgi:hypothetical protein